MALFPKRTEPSGEMLPQLVCVYRTEHQLSESTGTASRPKMHKMLGFFFLKRGYMGSLNWNQILKNGCFSLHIFYVEIKY